MGFGFVPMGGAKADSSFRVGHIGNHPLSDNALLVAALREAVYKLVCAKTGKLDD